MAGEDSRELLLEEVVAGDPQFSSSGFCLLVSKAFLFVRASARVNGFGAPLSGTGRMGVFSSRKREQ